MVRNYHISIVVISVDLKMVNTSVNEQPLIAEKVLRQGWFHSGWAKIGMLVFWDGDASTLIMT